MKRIPIILDGDPGHDDAICWTLASAFDEFDILAVTTVAGNQTIEKTTYNARCIMTLTGIDAPIAMGARHPLISEPIIAPNFHGVSGLDGPKMPEPVMEVSKLSAVELMAKVIQESDEVVTIVSTGPQTNVAQLLLTHPELKDKIRISMMGGGIARGNWNPAAEFNILVDPEAMKIELDSHVCMMMTPLDVTELAIVKPSEFDRIKQLNNKVADTVVGWLEFFYQYPMQLGYDGAPLHDPCALLALIHPEIFKIEHMYVDVELNGEYTRGATVGDIYHSTGHEPNVDVLMKIDRELFLDTLIEGLSKFSGGKHE